MSNVTSFNIDNISPISFGCMSLPQEQNLCNRLIAEAIDLGINFFDTADLYEHGENEKRLGAALKEKRQQVYIATKVGNRWKADGSWEWVPTRNYIIQAVEHSLKRLDTEYIDLYQLHGGTINDPIDEIVDAFELLTIQGKIRAYGISSIRPNVIREFSSRSFISTVMMQYSILDRRPEEECFPLLQQNKTGVLCRGTLAKGLLVNKPATSYLDHSIENVRKAQYVLQELSTSTYSAAQLALLFALASPAVTSAVVGIRNVEQLKQAAQVMSLQPMLSRTLHSIKKAVPALNYTEHV